MHRRSSKQPVPFYIMVFTCIAVIMFLNLVHTLRTASRLGTSHRGHHGGSHGSQGVDGADNDDDDDVLSDQRLHNKAISVDGGFHANDLLTQNANMKFADHLVKELLALVTADDERRLMHSSPAIRLSIFVSIVSYRDTLCRFTLRSLFSQALNPGTVFVGVVEQHSVLHSDPLCVHRSDSQLEALDVLERDASRLLQADHATTMQPQLRNQGVGGITGTFELIHAHVKVMHVPPWFGKGPAHARYLAAAMFSDEAYFLMIDSHSAFTLHWDRLLIESYLQLAIRTPGSPRGPVLAHHPPAWVPRSRNSVDVDENHDAEADAFLFDVGPADGAAEDTHGGLKLPFVCLAKYDVPELGFPILYSTVRNRTDKPRPQPFIGAGMLFTKGEVVHEVPFDPFLEYLFHGEEILLSARLWTAGYDFFAPNEVILRHYYYRRESAKYNNDSVFGLLSNEQQSARDRALENSILRVQYLLETTVYQPPWERKAGVAPKRQAPEDTTPEDVKADWEIYGVGAERTLRSFWQHAGIDPDERLQNQDTWCCRPDCPD